MKKILTSLLFASFGLAVIGQKTVKDPNAEKRNVSGFHAIEVSGGIDLYLSQGQETVVVSAVESEYRDKIKTEVNDGVLKIWYEHKSNLAFERGDKKLKAYVSFKELDALRASGGSDIYVDGTISVSKLSLRISGGSDFDGKVNVNEMKVESSGGSDVKVSGTTKNLRINASGGSDFKGYELITENCTVDASGGSDVYITVNKELDVNSSGGSDVFYKGNGAIRNLNGKSSNIKKV
jgi:hypothetical protein